MASLPQIPGYRVDAKLGAGGMGVVYAATKTETDLQYAIKMLLVGRMASFEQLARFRIEAEAHACLNHPGIVKIRDVGVALGCPYFATELAENGSLDAYLLRNPGASLEWRVRTIQRVAESLSHAHSRYIVHRDLKPANILIMGDGTPKVTDFGLGKFAEPEVTLEMSTFLIDPLNDLLRELFTYKKGTGRLISAPEASPHDSGDPRRPAVVKELSRCYTSIPEAGDHSFDLDAVQHFLKQIGNAEDLCAAEVSPNEAIQYVNLFSDALELPSAVTAELRTFVTTAKENGGPSWDRSSLKASRQFARERYDISRIGQAMGTPAFMAPEQARGDSGKIGPWTDVFGLGATLYTVLASRPPFLRAGAFDLKRPPSLTSVNGEIPEDLNAVVMKCLEQVPQDRYANMEALAEDLERVLRGLTPLASPDPTCPRGLGRARKVAHAVTESFSTLLPQAASKKVDDEATGCTRPESGGSS